MESTLTNDGNLELVFSSILPEDHEYCITRAQNIVEQINSFTSGSSGRKRQMDNVDNQPSSYQYIVGAVTAPGADSNTSEGANTAVASTLILMIMIIITLVLY